MRCGLSHPLVMFLILLAAVLLGGCSGGSSSGGSAATGGLDEANFDCTGGCDNQSLSVADVRRIVSQALDGAVKNGLSGTFAVVDRVGNVLALYQMEDASAVTTINGQIGAVGGLEGVSVPSTLAAISKAGTGAYLSSQGNAFSTRTASQIIQEHFYPGEGNQPGGPLFGVQFSQLICGDVTTLPRQFTSGVATGRKPLTSNLVGPRPMPLGLSADPGGIPLYKAGDVVGGIGVEVDGSYRLDREVRDVDDDVEERIALLASRGFEAPSERVADLMYAGGKTLRYTDLGYDDTSVNVEELPALDESRFVAAALFTDGTVRSGAVFGDSGSGVAETIRMGVPAAFLVGEGGSARFPTRGGSALPSGDPLSAAEVDALLDATLLTAARTRAAIRRPLDDAARVSIWIVDNVGTPLGFVRSQDAPVFGIDVALQKARGAAFFSSSDAGALLEQAGFGGYVSAARALIGADALTGVNAMADRALGNLSRPFFPDGIEGTLHGPFSKPFPGKSGTGSTWSPFNVGLQLDLVYTALVAPLGGRVVDACAAGVLGSRLPNGMQIFPGSVPLYRNGSLVGAIGISGDGVDQDDLIAFYGASREGLDYAGHLGIGDAVLGFNAPPEIRSDTIQIATEGLRLRYVNCPESPFIGESDQSVCEGL